MKVMPYMSEPWFALLIAAIERENAARVAARLNVSKPMISQVINGSGAYGTGAASTARLAERVVHKFGEFECPHLSEVYAEPRTISAPECRAHAHQAAPVGSSGALLHWRACQSCPHRALSAPPPPPEAKPKLKPRGKGAARATEPTATPTATVATATPTDSFHTTEEPLS